MTGLSHALFFTALLGVSFASVLFPTASVVRKNEVKEELLQSVEPAEETAPIEEQILTKKALSYSVEEIKLYSAQENRVETLGLEEYVVGVLLAEMPSWYEEEALKAAAVATRTYTLYKMNGTSHENGADVCDNPSHCQAFYSLPDAVLAWSEKSAVSAEEKIRRAVVETSGEILVYEGKPILAVYHASSFLKTRSSAEVFGGEVAYLQSVDVLHENEENTSRSEKTLTRDDVASALYNNGYLNSLLQEFTISSVWEGNKCVGMKVNDTLISASRVRGLFSLKSANFKIKEENGNFIFDVYGYGHGVGLSQSGANVLAKNGLLYEDILLYYYKGASLAFLKNNE